MIVVDDSGEDSAAGKTERLIRRWRPAGIDVHFLRNRRTKGASGAWNTGLDHLTRIYDDPGRLWVAILDDDDQWDSHHLDRSLTAAEQYNLDIVATQFWRIEESTEPLLEIPPPSLDIASFLVGNPGIQGSNLVCRLSVLLAAGLFDESLLSCTDRDLVIRIAELPGVRYGTTEEPTVRYFACKSRSRLSTPGSPAKLKGLDRFFQKYQTRMSEAEREAFRIRADKLFKWKESRQKATNDDDQRGVLQVPISQTLKSCQTPPHFIVGLIADNARLEEVNNLLADLRGLSNDSDFSGVDVLILENGNDQKSSKQLRFLVERVRKEGLHIHFVDRARHVEDAANGLVMDGGVSRGLRLAIASARTVLQSYLYVFAKKHPRSVVWIVDDDMRLDPLYINDGGRLQRRNEKLASALLKLYRIQMNEAVDVAIGTCTGAPPVPFAATVRVQLVDLVASLWWLASENPQAILQDRSLVNAELRSCRRDYYYDLSRNETDRLETPFWITPVVPGESVSAAFERIADKVGRIPAGEQVFRPLAIKTNSDSPVWLDDTIQRGGNTFVFNTETLRLAPNPSPVVNGRSSRRSDMIWALLQRDVFRKRVVSVPVYLHHDRSCSSAGELDADRMVDDIRGYALYSALQDTPGVFTATYDNRIVLAEEEIECFTRRVRSHLEERTATFRLSFHRIRGLTQVMHRLVNARNVWWQDDEYQVPRELLSRFCDFLTHSYEDGLLKRIEREVCLLDPCQIRGFLEQMPVEIEKHRSRIHKFYSSAYNLDRLME